MKKLYLKVSLVALGFVQVALAQDQAPRVRHTLANVNVHDSNSEEQKLSQALKFFNLDKNTVTKEKLTQAYELKKIQMKSNKVKAPVLKNITLSKGNLNNNLQDDFERIHNFYNVVNAYLETK